MESDEKQNVSLRCYSLGEAVAAEKVRTWLGQVSAADHPSPFVLNVAGSRKSRSGGIQKCTRCFLAEVLAGMIQEK